MDDSCAVCADSLEWVAYGSCGHREVCSTCVVRLRFICGDSRCCICKTESTVVFITKALGEYTRFISDFSAFPSEPREGRLGSFWYHEDSQAFFDDVDHYRMIKAMCRLSCSVCDKMDGQSKDGPRHRGKLKSIEQLKGHLYHRHRLHMCSLCLEGRKVFICEQKLYTRAQLNQHISTGDSEVDGSESERGGFTGHPLCEFCRTPFYGDNELYSHMSTEHYTCHICQRQHPGQYEYYKNYDDLEIHFRREHFLCEDETCLAKKFIVFQNEAELKRHNTREHGGRMSRSQRSAALQIPTSFRFRRNNEQNNRRGRARLFHREPTDNELSAAIQASMETARTEGVLNEPTTSSSPPVFSDTGIMGDGDPLIQSFESLSTAETEPSSRYLQALGHSTGNVRLGESSFPPLSGGTQGVSRQNFDGLATNTMADRLRRKSNQKTAVGTAAPAWPAVNHGSAHVISASTQVRPLINNAPGRTHVTSASTQVRPSINTAPVRNPPLTTSLGTSSGPSVPAAVHERTPGPAWGTGNGKRIPHSTSAPNLSDRRLLEPSVSDFPPVSATQPPKVPVSGQALNVGNVQSANKSLVEKLRAALGNDEEKYAIFKEISGLYRQGVIDTISYLNSVKEFGLSHLVLELARLCPDPKKQKELVDTYDASLRGDNQRENGGAKSGAQTKNSGTSKKDKGKSVNTEGSSSRDAPAESFLDTVRRLQSDHKSSEEDVDVSSKGSYRTSKIKSKLTIDERPVELTASNQPVPKPVAPDEASSAGRGLGIGGKQRKKTSKFHRVRLGDGSMAALFDPKSSEPDPDLVTNDNGSDGNQNPPGGLPVRGVWRKGGVQKLFS